MKAEDKVNLIAAFHFVEGGLLLVGAIASAVLPLAAAQTGASPFLARLPEWFLGLSLLAVGGFISFLGLVDLILGWGLWQTEHWSRMATLVVAVVRLFVFPIGTVFGGLILYIMLQDEVRELFRRPEPPPQARPLLRVAVLSDIHGNPIALKAVLKDIQASGGVDSYWVLGDVAAIGYDPRGALEAVTRLPEVYFTRGNTDRYVVTGERPGPALQDVAHDPARASQALAVDASFAWTEAAINPAGWRDWLAQLPLEQRTTLPDGTRVLGVHAAPGTDDGDGIRPIHTDGELRRLLAGCQADLVLVGHTHVPLDRIVDGVRVVNLGSVSNPMAPDLRAKYVLLYAFADGYHLEHRFVPYDLNRVIKAVGKSGHPAAGFISGHFRGERRPAWETA